MERTPEGGVEPPIQSDAGMAAEDPTAETAAINDRSLSGERPSGALTPTEATGADTTATPEASSRTASGAPEPASERTARGDGDGTGVPAPARNLMPVAVAAVLVVAALLIAAGVYALTRNKASSTPTPQALPTQSIPPTPVVTGGSTAAIVNGQAVPISQFRELLVVAQRQSAGQPVGNQTLAKQAMNQVIVFSILRQYAAKHHLSVTDAQINQTLARDSANAGGQAQLTQRLQHFGLSLDQYKGLLRNTLLARAVAAQVAPVSNKKVPYAHVEHILIATHPQGKKPLSDSAAQTKASNLLNQIKRGASFANLARKNSDDPGSAARGGDLGKVFRHQTVPPFDKAAFGLALNQPSLIKSIYGYHVIEVLGRGTAAQPAASQQQLQQRQFGIWIQKQVKAAKIKRLAKVTG